VSQPAHRDRLWAVRGAVVAAANDEASIRAATTELMSEIMERNEMAADHMVSVIFTATDDLDAAFPAAAARDLGLNAVPLLCAREIDVPGSMARVIRVLLHYYAGAEDPPEHVYLGDAQKLRADLHDAQ
jgi:chorismate mutase